MRVRSVILALGALAAATMPGCFCNKGPKPGEKIPYALCVEGSQKLNWSDDRANTLFVRIFQLSSTDAFQQADPSRLLGHDAMPPGLVGTPMDRTVFPGAKQTVDTRLDPDCVALGIVAGYFHAQGQTKIVRKVIRPSDDVDDATKEKDKACVLFGPNGIEAP